MPIVIFPLPNKYMPISVYNISAKTGLVHATQGDGPHPSLLYKKSVQSITQFPAKYLAHWQLVSKLFTGKQQVDSMR